MSEELQPVFEDWDSRVMEVEEMMTEVQKKVRYYHQRLADCEIEEGVLRRVAAILRRDGQVNGD